MTTESFLEYVESNLDGADKFDYKNWIYAAGLPDDCPEVTTEELASVEKACEAFVGGMSPTEIESKFETSNWTTHHWNHFLRELPKLTTDQMKSLDAKFQFTQSGNSEITHDWLTHVIESDYEPGMQRLREFLTEQGRRKFLQPLYEKLCETKEGKETARQIYSVARPGYHAVSRQTIDTIVGVPK